VKIVVNSLLNGMADFVKKDAEILQLYGTAKNALTDAKKDTNIGLKKQYASKLKLLAQQLTIWSMVNVFQMFLNVQKVSREKVTFACT